MTQIDGSIAVVTGGQRGIGRALVAELLARGAKKVYATARVPAASADPRVVAVPLDVTDQSSVDALAALATDARLVVNNAGMGGLGGLLTSSIESTAEVFETNLFGAIRVTKAFAPVLAENGCGVFVNLASVLSWLPFAGAYGASKAALWHATNSLRIELAPQGTQVVGAYLGYTDTDLTEGIDAPKNTPEFVASRILDSVAADEPEALVDDLAKLVRSRLGGPIDQLIPA